MKQMSVLPVLLFFLSLSAIHAQSTAPAIKVLAKAKDNGVWLRWAPTNFTMWELGNKYGYSIERFTLKSDGSLESLESVKLTSASIRPYPPYEFETLTKTVPEAEAIQQLIYTTESVNKDTKESPAGILKNQEDANNRFGIALLICDLKPALAKAAGLFFNDSSAVTGSRYIYKIKLAPNPSPVTAEPGIIVVDVMDAKPLKAFTDLQATFGDQTVTLSWPIFTHTGIYTAYIVEKSQDGNTYTPATELPFIPMSESEKNQEAHFVDSLQTNTATFFYRVKGITPFGEEGPPSNVVKGTGKDNITGLLVLREVKRVDKNVLLQWEFPKEFENKVSGFTIGKSTKAEGPYKEISPKTILKTSRSQTDTAPSSSMYYQVKAMDGLGNEITHSLPYFLHTEDNTPPAIPTGLSGNVNPKGIVSLTWKPASDGDLQGYRVFSSNSLREEFVEVTRKILVTPSYSDTINMSVLNKKVFYKVISVDRNFNTSDYSKPLTLSRPDLIPPTPPVFSKTDKTDKGIELTWTNSISSDAARYVLYRSDASDTLKANLLNWSAGKPKTDYSDNSISEGKTYRYQLYVYDSAGNFSIASSKEIKTESGIRKPLDDLTAIIDRGNKNITLKWNYESKAKKCLLYRRKNDEPFSLYQSLDGALKEFVDVLVVMNNTYSYKIQLILETNAKTQLSKELKVPF